MPEYVVIAAFNDKVEEKLREVGDVIDVDIDRAKHLAQVGVIDFIENSTADESGLVSLGGGYYKLPNGDKVRGREKALEALSNMNSSEQNESSQSTEDQNTGDQNAV